MSTPRKQLIFKLIIRGLSCIVLCSRNPWRRVPAFIVALVAISLSHEAMADQAKMWSASVSEQTGLPVLTRGGRDAMTASFAFWGNGWSWANLSGNFKIIAPSRYIVTCNNKMLDFDLNGKITTPSNNQLMWEIDLDAHSTKTNARGGIIFKFDLNVFGKEMGDPQPLPNNKGWVWGKAGGSRLEMRIEPSVPTLYFERGNKNELRAFFFDGPIVIGKQRYKMVFSMSKDMTIRPTISERFGVDDASLWPVNNLDWQTSPVDLSFLNVAEKPAGRHGFVKAAGESLVFEDGARARFWGTNITAAAVTGTSMDNVKRQAKRLSALGFNLVRVTHHDSHWVNPNIFGKDATDTQTLDPAYLKKLDWWIKCLKEEGVYVWLDLHVQRGLTAGDQIHGFDEIQKGRKTADLNGYNYVNPSIQKAMKRFNEAYLNHVNSYTDVAYKNEPAIMGLLITNENDVTHHFGNSLLPDKNVPIHSRWYMNQAEAFAAKTGLPSGKVWRSWEPGPSKLFLNDLERNFNVDMISHLRGFGVKMPIATTSIWGDDTLSSLPALTAGDIIDVHAYGGALELEKDPLMAANMANWLSVAQVAGKPMSVTEWNVFPFPIPDRHSNPVYIASIARLQGWDAVMQYAYGQIPLNDAGTPSNWHAFNDPALVATLPAAALIYRQGHVKEAVTTYVLSLSREQLFYQAHSPDTSIAVRTASEKGKLVIAMPKVKDLPWLKSGPIPSDAKVIHDLNQSMLDRSATEVLSDTGEIRRNWVKGVYAIDTPRTQAAMGWVGNETIALSDVKFDIKTRNATVAVQSLDGAPIRRSKSLMISLGARSIPSGYRLPFRSEPVLGQLTIRAPKGLRLYKRISSLQEKEILAKYNEGRYLVELDSSLFTSWLFMR